MRIFPEFLYHSYIYEMSLWSTFIYFGHLHVYIVSNLKKKKKEELFCRRAECNFSGLCSHPNYLNGALTHHGRWAVTG